MAARTSGMDTSEEMTSLAIYVPVTYMTKQAIVPSGLTFAQAWNSLPTNVTASTALPSFKRQLKTFYLPNLSHHFKLLSHICVPCPRSYLAYATLISTFYYN